MTQPPLTCEHFQTLLEADPYCWTPEIQAHRKTCPACRMAHLLFLAQADIPAEHASTTEIHPDFEALTRRVVDQLPHVPPSAYDPIRWTEARTWLPVAALLLLTFGLWGPHSPVPEVRPTPVASSVATDATPSSDTSVLEEQISDPFHAAWIPSNSDLVHSDEWSTFLPLFDSKEVDAILAELDLTDLHLFPHP